MASGNKVDKLTAAPKAARSADKVRAKLAARGISERDVADALKWAREQE